MKLLIMIAVLLVMNIFAGKGYIDYQERTCNNAINKIAQDSELFVMHSNNDNFAMAAFTNRERLKHLIWAKNDCSHNKEVVEALKEMEIKAIKIQELFEEIGY